jgi:hypothetical protein
MQDIDNNPIEQMPYLSGLLLKQFIERMAWLGIQPFVQLQIN